MKILVVYYSRYGNTRKVAEAIAQTLQSRGTARALDFADLKAADLSGVDLLIGGCPTHNMNLPTDLRPLLEGLPKGSLKGASIAAYDTSYQMSAFLARMTAAKRLLPKLRRLGGKPIAPPETFLVGKGKVGLYEGEIERAKVWANTIVERASL